MVARRSQRTEVDSREEMAEVRPVRIREWQVTVHKGHESRGLRWQLCLYVGNSGRDLGTSGFHSCCWLLQDL